MNERDNTEQPPEEPRKKHGFFQLILSLLAGAIGVQSNKNRERDFQDGDIRKFVAGGLIFTILFILILIVIVNVAIS